MAPTTRSLVPPARDLALLSDTKVQSICDLTDREGQRYHRYAMFGMACGTMSFFACLATSAYLVRIGSPKMAAVVLGAAVLSTVGKMLASRM